ncbi:hypothetical protein KP509_01G051000 [Ceratopteris richardii]|uniref:Uncharacterized protein n=1 Tax=Ceratopteris richardii TaxID=49495 RepID=A0A8T2VPD4_CERRI|nr:hypothetical protein KP509_01G051000 [Ceratopteris richardii]
MEAIAPERDHLLHHRSKPLFYASRNMHLPETASEDSSLCNSSHGVADVQVKDISMDDNGCENCDSNWIPSLTSSRNEEGERPTFDGQCDTNGPRIYDSDKVCQNCEMESEVLSHASRESSHSAKQDGGTLVGFRDGTGEAIKTVQSADTVEIDKRMGPSMDTLESTISNALDYTISQCYSSEDWSSQPSTDSPFSTSAPPVCASPGFSRCRTAPVTSPVPLGGSEPARNLWRSKTDKEKKEKVHSGLSHMPSPVEILSERKRKKLIQNFVKIKNDGTVEVDVDRASTLLDLDVADQVAEDLEDECRESMKSIPSYLEIAMLIVGTRGDVQPFVAIGKRLKEKGHRVRLATHANFRSFVISNGLEFYPLGGDPKVLAGYMVKNKGFLPSGPSEISIQKKQLKAIMNSLLPACTKPDGGSGTPFKADAIIANPPAYGHVHVAEYLDVPLHIFFTMPWTPTNEFPHPLARVKQQAGYRMSYHVVDSLMWWGMRGLINEFRVKELHLNPMNYFSWNQGSIAHLPTGYMWSPHLVPKPQDWGPLVDVVGFCYLSLAHDYTPPDSLVKWLAAGQKPIYVGFGSLPVEQPKKMTDIIVEALKHTNQRGIIDKGWGGLGNYETPDFIYLLENCPHDWLFPQCAAVVHHGGAGTTAAGLKAGCPTTIVPFFGDQPFWGERVYAKGVGPPPIPVQQFSLEKLVQAMTFMQDPEVKQRALELSAQILEEDGVEVAVDAFYRHWDRRPPKTQLTSGSFSLCEAFLIRVRRLWCLPWCFD